MWTRNDSTRMRKMNNKRRFRKVFFWSQNNTYIQSVRKSNNKKNNFQLSDTELKFQQNYDL